MIPSPPNARSDARWDLDGRPPGPPLQKERRPSGEELVLWSALQLARRRKYDEAEAVLVRSRFSQPETRAQVYDLLARIRVRQQRYAEAKDLWEKASAQDPDRRHYKRAGEVLPLVPILRKGLIVAALAILVALAFAAGHIVSRRGTRNPDEGAAGRTVGVESPAHTMRGEEVRE